MRSVMRCVRGSPRPGPSSAATTNSKSRSSPEPAGRSAPVRTWRNHCSSAHPAGGFRFTAERFYEIGFLNRLVDADQLIPTALAMAEHLLTLPPASRVNTVHMMRHMRPLPSAEQQRLAAALHEHGAKSDLIESRAAFAEKRPPQFKGWDDPEERYRPPSVDASKG